MTTERERRVRTLETKGLQSTDDAVLSLAQSNIQSTGLVTISNLEPTSELQDTDMLVLSRSSAENGVYDQSFSIKISNTSLSNSLESEALPINVLSDVDVVSPAGHQVLAYNGTKWTNYSWDYLMKDKLQIIDGVGPPADTCDNQEWKEVSKIYVCQSEGKIVFYFNS